MTGAGDPDRRGPQLTVALVAAPLSRRICAAALVLLALAARSVDWPLVFPGDGSVWLEPFDGLYRVRRALYTLERFPQLLRFDPFLAYPSGAPVPAPPLYDWLLGAAARALGGDTATLERVAAWSSPVLAALAVLPIAAAGACVGSPALGLAAAALYALLPVAINFAHLGDADHHGAVALLGALLLAQTLRLARGAPPRRETALWVAVALTRVALVLIWSGSLLYIAVADGVLLGLGLLAGGRWLSAHALGLAAGALLLAPAAAAERAGGGPAFTSTTFSWLHVATLSALAAFAGALAAGERVRAARGPGRRALRAAALAAAVLGVLAAWPGSRAAWQPALAFLTRADAWGHANLEQRPLFPWLTRTPLRHGRPATALYGAYAYLIPLAPAAALARARDPRRRRAALALCAWCAALGALAIGQVRFGNEFAAPGSIGFALLLAECGGALARRLPAGAAMPRVVGAATLAIGAALLWPAIAAVHRPALERAISLARVPALAQGLVETSGNGSLRRFAEAVRVAAPDALAERDPFARPSFGVLASPNLGYALLYYARRGAPATNAGPYVDLAVLSDASTFFAEASEDRALAIARRLDARYAITSDHEWLEPGTLEFRLQREAGSADWERAHLARFRLVTEGPKGGRPLFHQFGSRPARGEPPYRLFELVEGALLRVPAQPGADVVAEIRLASPFGRDLVWRARGRAAADGVAQLRVPYSTRGSAPVHALGPYRVRAGRVDLRAEVDEAAVREGAVIEVETPARDAAQRRDGARL